MTPDVDTITVATSYYKELMFELANLRHQKELTIKLLNKLQTLLEQITPKPNVAILDWIQWIQAAEDELHRRQNAHITVNLPDNTCPECGQLFISIPRLGIFHKCEPLKSE